MTLCMMWQCASALFGWNTLGKISCWAWDRCEHCSCSNLYFGGTLLSMRYIYWFHLLNSQFFMLVTRVGQFKGVEEVRGKTWDFSLYPILRIWEQCSLKFIYSFIEACNILNFSIMVCRMWQEDMLLVLTVTPNHCCSSNSSLYML